MEEWRDVVGFEGLYEVSNCGRVRHTGGKEIKGSINSYGYRAFSIYKNGKRHTGKAHRLVAQAFIPNPENKEDVNHKDGDKDNNFIGNLEWATRGENNNHARTTLGTDFSAKSVVQISPNGDVIAVWPNFSIPSRVLGISAQLISACCRGTAKSTGDYFWRYTEFSFARGIKELQAVSIKEKLSELTEQLSTIEQELSQED